jgi:extracellular elastinolytic metalloproteinase
MQMFVWTHPLPNYVTVHSPGGVAGNYSASRAQFGPQLTLAGLSGTAVVTNDGVDAGGDACQPLVGFPAGSIAIVDRGTCEFGFKALTAQNAGAIGVIVANNAPGAPITMGPGLVGNLVTIPAVMVSQADGDTFKAAAPLSVTLRLNPLLSINRDSDFDNGIIAHEYGHGISNRLTGGPAIVTCLNNAEQMGEGWSDWFALVLTTHPSDTLTTARGIATYVAFEGSDGDGIRPTPYSTDTTVNPSTYASVANVAQISQPHGIGYVWNTMLWEMYWKLVDRHGYNANIYDAWSTAGNNLAIQLVMDGLKFQPCLPGFVDGRNAILAADVALTAGKNRCEIWRAFAKRGLGFSASQGLSTSRTDGVEAFDLPASCTSATFGGFRAPIVAGPAINNVKAGSLLPVRFTLSDPAGELVVDHQPVSCTTLEPTGERPTIIDPSKILREGTKYAVSWQTESQWLGSCRRLTLRIPAANDAVAYFRFK